MKFFRRYRLAMGVLALVTPLLVGAANAESLAGVRNGPTGSAFWDVPAKVDDGAKRGDIYWVQRRTDAPEGSTGWNIIYVTEGVGGQLVYVSGEIYIPVAKSGKARPLALWNHETSGTEDSCAPSRNNLSSENWTRIPAVTELLKRGYVVVGSDYQGLGTPGETAYLNGPAQAYASLDAVRAAVKFPDSNAETRFTTYGWSQGGQTSLWVSHLQESYAPELDLLGVVGIAPASRHWDLTEYDLTTTITGGYYIMRMAGLSVGHPELKLRDVLSTEGLEMLTQLSAGCWAIAEATNGTLTTVYANQAGLKKGEPWRVRLEQNDAFLPAKKVPFLFFQGDKDTAVPAALTRSVAKDLCNQEVQVDYRRSPDLDHENIVPVAEQGIPDWFDARFKNEKTVNSCSTLAD
ncbi:putative hydrolase or acyltransferase of alpha/beta superfamily [Phyllobacterium sp. YR531]|nr:putative hydrolase or acyltransferase of alpha/beta superfamily [Phyllobacterium sp. YR531]